MLFGNQEGVSAERKLTDFYHENTEGQGALIRSGNIRIQILILI